MNARALTYEAAGATSPRESIWSAAPAGLRRFEQTISIGHGDALWDAAARAVANWEVKQRSGFRVHPQRTVSEGAEFVISFGWGPLAVHEPVRIVTVVDTDTRRGFAYGNATRASSFGRRGVHRASGCRRRRLSHVTLADTARAVGLLAPNFSGAPVGTEGLPASISEVAAALIDQRSNIHQCPRRPRRRRPRPPNRTELAGEHRAVGGLHLDQSPRR